MRSIVITGFMGTGKTEVGRAVAQKLGRAFVDTDARIEILAGKEIPEIFTSDGQEAFRAMERRVYRELAAKQDLVIATGGGTLIDQTNRELTMKSATVICLSATRDEIIRRLHGTDVAARPLLGEDPEAAIDRLLKTRRAVYKSFPWRIDTTHLSIEEVAERVIEIAQERTFTVRYPNGKYEIRICDGLLSGLGKMLKDITAGPIAIVTNTIVAPLYAARLEESLRDAGFDPFTCLIEDGEEHKRLSTVEGLYGEFLAGGLDRSGTVVSLGGGVTGDIAGFAAATFMRGVKFVQVPTTLLSMVDASVGGKTGVDLPAGKNLVGAFKQPEFVLIDPRVLFTLPADELRNGIAETIKHGVIGSPELFAELECSSKVAPIPAARIASALQVKIEIVQQDPYEQGVRAVLNLGHTVGHALERLSDFKLPHGRAVAIGLVAAARIAVRLKLAKPEITARIEKILSSWQLPIRVPPLSTKEIIAAMAHDKKRLNGRLRFILPRKLGAVEIVEDVPQSVIEGVLSEMKGE